MLQPPTSAPGEDSNSRTSKVVHSTPSVLYCSITLVIDWWSASEWTIVMHWTVSACGKLYATQVPLGALAAASSLPAHWVPDG